MVIARQPITLEQFLSLPETKPALEYWEGMVTQKVSPKAHHGLLQFTLGNHLHVAAKLGRLGQVFTETRCTFNGSSFVPDLVFFLRDRIPLGPDGEVAEDLVAAPDVAIEIVSPGQSIQELALRCQWYVDNGSRVSLLIEPRRRIVRLFRRGIQPRIMRGADPIDLSDILPAFHLTVQELFAALRPA
jgi:Uma2 family endonuclease